MTIGSSEENNNFRGLHHRDSFFENNNFELPASYTFLAADGTGATIAVGDNVTVGPSIGYSLALDEDLTSEFIWGLSAAIEF